MNQKVEEPANTAGDKPGFSLGTDNTKANAAAVPGTIKKTKKSKAVAQDLNDYVNKDLRKINPDELTALTAFDKVTGRNYTNETVTFKVVRDTVLPAYTRFVKRAEAIEPKTPEVKNVHQFFVQSARVKQLAFRHLLEGQGDKSAAWQFGVKAEFEASTQLANQFKIMVSSLAEDQGVKLP